MISLLFLPLLPFILGIGIGGPAHWHGLAKARRLAEMERLTAPLPAPRLNLTDQYALTPIGGRGWPKRQTPTDLAAAYDETPAPAPSNPTLVLQEPVRVHATVGGREPCNNPCTALHCIHHAAIIGSIAQRFRWNTDTAEFSLLGLSVPDFLDVRSVVFQDVT